MPTRRSALLVALLFLFLGGCRGDDAAPPAGGEGPGGAETSTIGALVDQYATVRLTADLSRFPDADRQLIRHLIEAAEIMDDVFWQQTYGDRTEALALAGSDEA